MLEFTVVRIACELFYINGIAVISACFFGRIIDDKNLLQSDSFLLQFIEPFFINVGIVYHIAPQTAFAARPYNYGFNSCRPYFTYNFLNIYIAGRAPDANLKMTGNIKQK